MFRGLAEKIMQHRARRELKKIKSAIHFPVQASSIQRVLVILPRDLQLIEPAHQFVNQLRQAFPAWHIQMFDVDKLPAEKLNWLKIPDSAYIQELKSQQFDMVIDLNRHGDWLVTYLAVMSGAPYRVQVENGDKQFFNIQYNTHQDAPFGGLIEAFSRLFIRN